jgi:hypothetical protein
MGSFVLQACTKRHQVPRQKYEIIRNNETKGTFDGTNSKPDQKLGRDDTTWITEIQAEYNYRFFPDRAKANWKHIDPSGKQPTPTTKTSLRSYYPVPTPAAHVRASAASTSWLRTIATLSPRDKTTTNQLATARNRRRSPTTACRGTGEAQRLDSAPQLQLAAAQRGSHRRLRPTHCLARCNRTESRAAQRKWSWRCGEDWGKKLNARWEKKRVCRFRIPICGPGSAGVRPKGCTDLGIKSTAQILTDKKTQNLSTEI